MVSQWPKQVFYSQRESAVVKGLDSLTSYRKHYVFNHKMNAACRQWLTGSRLYTNSSVTQIRYLNGQGWQLKLNDAWQAELFDIVVLTAPWPQTQELIAVLRRDTMLDKLLVNSVEISRASYIGG